MKVIDSSQWFEVVPDRNGDLIDITHTYTLDELKAAVQEEWESMSEDEKHFRMIHVDPTYLSWALSYAGNRMRDDYKVEVDEFNFRLRIIQE